MAPVLLLEPQTSASVPERVLVARDFREAAVKAGKARGVFAENINLLDDVGSYRAELRGDHALFVNAPLGPGMRAVLDLAFRYVVARPDVAAVLPEDQLLEAFAAANRRDLVVAVTIAPDSLILYRGDLDAQIVPVKWFTDLPSFPGLDRIEILDYGQTLRFGDFEIAVDAVLYEFDRDYRRRSKSNALAVDRTFGGALRRLRLQRRLSRSDFPGLSEKEIARIERGEVKRPHGRTLQILSATLRVGPEEIATY